MRFFRKMRAFALVFAVLTVALGFAMINAPKPADAARLCCYRVCTINPPITCWDECKPCPKFP
ncbi:MAG: hypothetical protein Q8O10_08655 [candidate division Zixibacteria bacterium]|nr:hypothetical protein [candidate division Zixibacteria bacterium]